jgi:hypothetical protein
MQRALNAWVKEDHNYAAGAALLGIDVGTFRHQVTVALAEGLTPEKEGEKPRIRIPSRSVYRETPNKFGKPVRVFVFGCAHDSPAIKDKSRFRNAGRLASELGPDLIIDLGDSLDLDSLSTHAPLGSVDDQARHGFLIEVESVDEAYGAFHETAPPPDQIPRKRLKGNHEHRADRFEANNPTSEGVYTVPLSQVFARYGWSEKQFREWIYVEGVGFTHAPINGLGKEVAGKFPDQVIAQEATHSICWSHTHKNVLVNRPKYGAGNQIRVYNTGSFMPQGYIKAYAGMSLTGWTYGVSELTLRDGLIESHRFWSELELRERYS